MKWNTWPDEQHPKLARMTRSDGHCVSMGRIANYPNLNLWD
jgi:hypothetical protein